MTDHEIILELHAKDQQNIQKFRRGEMKEKELVEKTKEISDEFMIFLETMGFLYRNAFDPHLYRACITLTLNLAQKDMEEVFKRYIEPADTTQIDPEHRAMISDKICILSGKKQIYGTQFLIQDSGKVIALPIENDKDVDKVRGELGLKPLKEYLEQIGGSGHEHKKDKHDDKHKVDANKFREKIKEKKNIENKEVSEVKDTKEAK